MRLKLKWLLVCLLAAVPCFASPSPPPNDVISLLMPHIFAMPQNPPGAYGPSVGGGGSGTINSCATTNALAIYTASTTTGCGNGDFTYATHTITAASGAALNMSGAGTNTFILPSQAALCTVTAALCSDSTTPGQMHMGNNGGENFFAWAGSSGQGATNCATALQYVTAISSAAAPSCASLATSAATLQKNETTTPDANVLTVTPAASAGTYRACVVISVSAATSGVISWTLSWTDSNGTAQSNIAQDLFQQGTAAPNTTFTTSAAGNYNGCSVIDVNNAAANIVVKWVGGGTTTAKMSATVERLI